MTVTCSARAGRMRLKAPSTAAGAGGGSWLSSHVAYGGSAGMGDGLGSGGDLRDSRTMLPSRQPPVSPRRYRRGEMPSTRTPAPRAESIAATTC
jgi:hypothetical protein